MWFQKHGTEQRQDVHSLNEVKRYGLEKPGYPQDLSQRRVLEFVYLPYDEVLLLGSMDGQYPFWVSRTGIHDTKTNAEIAHAILFETFSAFTKASPNLNSLIRDRYRRRFNLMGKEITTPFDYGLSSEPGQVKYWGQHIATGIARHYDVLRELCSYRELDGQYLGFLQSYLAMLEVRTSDAVRDYEGRRSLIKLLQSEDYLYVSHNPAIRDTYVRIRQAITDLYNEYMTIVR